MWGDRGIFNDCGISSSIVIDRSRLTTEQQRTELSEAQLGRVERSLISSGSCGSTTAPRVPYIAGRWLVTFLSALAASCNINGTHFNPF